MRRRPSPHRCPYTTLFRSYVGKSVCLRQRVRSYFGEAAGREEKLRRLRRRVAAVEWIEAGSPGGADAAASPPARLRSEEHTSELQSHSDLVCRLLLEKKKD